MTRVYRRILGLGLIAIMLTYGGLALAHNGFEPRPDYKVSAPDPWNERTDYVNESFETWPPADWVILNLSSTYTWVQSSNEAHTGGNSAFVQYGPQGTMQDEWLITPALDLSGTVIPQLEWFEAEAYWPDYGHHHYVMVSTTSQTDPAAFTVVSDMTPANHSIYGMDAPPVTVDLSAYAGEPVVYVALRYTGDWADNWYVDDMRVYEPNDHDVAVVAVAPDGVHFDGGAVMLPQVTVGNVGLNTESFDVVMEISESDTIIYNEMVGATGLAAGTEVTLDFPTLTLAAGNYYLLSATTALAGDEDPNNDTGTAMVETYTETFVPLAFLFTNSGCAPCVNSNQAMDTYIPTQGNNVALMRIHSWWPNAGDIMFTANEEQNTSLITEYGVNGVPNFRFAGFMDLGTDYASVIDLYNDTQVAWKAPLSINLLWNQGMEQLSVFIDVVNAMDPTGDYRLYCGITEDGIVHNGGNGEPIHNQAFRYMYPDALEGIAVPTTIGYYQFTVDCPLDGGWVYDNLRATVYIEDLTTGKFIQAGTGFLTELSDVTPVALNSFRIESHPGSVSLNWSADRIAEFRLVRIQEGNEVEVAYSQDHQGNFNALDSDVVLAAGGQFDYQLSGRLAGEHWVVLRSEQVEVAAAALVTRLDGSWPNPFNPTTTIAFTLADEGNVTIGVYDLGGRLVKILIDSDSMQAGSFSVGWNGVDGNGQGVASGIYFVRLLTRTHSESRKIVLTK